MWRSCLAKNAQAGKRPQPRGVRSGPHTQYILNSTADDFKQTELLVTWADGHRKSLLSVGEKSATPGLSDPHKSVWSGSFHRTPLHLRKKHLSRLSDGRNSPQLPNEMQTPTSVGSHQGMGDTGRGRNLWGPDFMMLINSEECCIS
jgi:hypothetical protein